MIYFIKFDEQKKFKEKMKEILKKPKQQLKEKYILNIIFILYNEL